MPLFPQEKRPGILHIIGHSKYGGGTMVVFSLVEMAKVHGLRPAILTDDPATIKVCKERNIETLNFSGIIRPIRPWTDIKAIRHLTKLLRQRNDTIVHTHTLKGGLVGRYAAHKAGVPVIIHHNHGFSFQADSSVVRKGIITIIEKFAANKCDKIISVNRSDVDFAARKGIGSQQKFVTVPNGVNCASIEDIPVTQKHELCKTLAIEHNSILIVIIARLFSEKGHPWLFEALPMIKTSMQRPIHLLVFGDGPHHKKYI